MMITKIECPSCKKEFTIKDKYDDNLNTVIVCTHCKLKASIWSFNYIGERNKTFTESIIGK